MTLRDRQGVGHQSINLSLSFSSKFYELIDSLSDRLQVQHSEDSVILGCGGGRGGGGGGGGGRGGKSLDLETLDLDLVSASVTVVFVGLTLRLNQKTTVCGATKQCVGLLH